MSYNRFLSTVLVLSLVFLLFGCANETENVSSDASETIESNDIVSEEPLVEQTYEINNKLSVFKFFGRMNEIDNGMSCDFTASGIEFEGKMTGDVVLSLSCDRDTYFTLYIDGIRQEERVYVTPEINEVRIATFDGEEVHNIKILKQTEAQWSLCVLKELKITGKLNDTPKDKEYYIEFIGDSITTGYGNIGDATSQNPGTALWQDGTRAYAYLTAEALNADYSIIGCSGIGIDKGWTTFSECDFYPKASYYRDPNGENYDFAKVPDLVVINLGTNDQDRGSTRDAFVNGVRDLIEYIRSSYKKEIPIIWVYNMVNNGRFTWTMQVINRLGGEDSGLYFIQLDPNRDGGNTHPSADAHQTASEKLAKFIKDKGLLD